MIFEVHVFLVICTPVSRVIGARIDVVGDEFEFLVFVHDGQAAMQSVSPEAVFDSSRSCAAAVVQVMYFSFCFGRCLVRDAWTVLGLLGASQAH